MDKQQETILRALIGILIGCILIFMSYKYYQKLAAAKEKPKQKVEKEISKIYVQKVVNETIPVVISEKGNLEAYKKVDLYSEVQGILDPANIQVKAGQAFGKGDLIFSIDDAEFKASLLAQKSTLYNLITQALPDLKLDYPDVFDKWNSYLNGFDIKRQTPQLPDFSNDKEKFFINSRNIVTNYYNIKNLEERHKKYRIYAPFYGLVTEANVTPGGLVRPGQKLASILSPSRYELAVSINESYKKYISVGKSVKLHNLERTKSWTGKIVRIDPIVNTNTQGTQVYIQVKGKGLNEGMFLEAELGGKSVENSFELPRKLLIENNKTFLVKDGKLELYDLDVELYKDKTAIVTNLKDGDLILQNVIPGAYDGMLIEIVNETSE